MKTEYTPLRPGTRRGRRRWGAQSWAMLFALLLTALAYLGGGALFLLFCTEVWFR